jgi:endonuclease/exonuclease/phosphatase family metal-dependent hydrolase
LHAHESNCLKEGKAEPLELVIPFIEDRGYRDLWIENGKKGQMFTAWTKNPLMRIDYFFASKTFSHKIVECITDASPASDHFPITLQIQLLT